MCDQNCGVQPADRQTDTHTHTGTDKSLKTEGPKILSNDIFYFRTVIIGGPKTKVKTVTFSFTLPCLLYLISNWLFVWNVCLHLTRWLAAHVYRASPDWSRLTILNLISSHSLLVCIHLVPTRSRLWNRKLCQSAVYCFNQAISGLASLDFELELFLFDCHCVTSRLGSRIELLFVPFSRGVQIGTDWPEMGQIWDFEVQFEYILVWAPKCTETDLKKSQICPFLGPTWPNLGPTRTFLTIPASFHLDKYTRGTISLMEISYRVFLSYYKYWGPLVMPKLSQLQWGDLETMPRFCWKVTW